MTKLRNWPGKRPSLCLLIAYICACLQILTPWHSHGVSAQLLVEDDAVRDPWYTQIWKDYYKEGFPHASLFLKGNFTEDDRLRMQLREYPFGNSTAKSLQQYKKDVVNGNSYNLVGDSVGDLPTTLFDRDHAKLSVARSNGGSAATNGYVIFAGGVFDNSNPSVARQTDIVDIYHEPSRTWSTAKLSQPRQDLTGLAVGNLLLFAGGWYNDEDEVIHNSDVVDIFDTETGTWLAPTKLTEARAHVFAASTRSGLGFFAGGNAGFYSQVYYSDRIDVYNSTTRSWEKTLKLPQARAYFSGGCAQGTCVFGGGYYLGHYTSMNNPTITNRIDVLNVEERTWEKMQLLEGRASMGSAVVRDRFVIFAGGIAESGRSDMINIYDVQIKRFTHGYLSLARSALKCMSLNYIAVCVGGIADGGTIDKGVQWQKEGQAMRAQRMDVISLFKRSTDIVTQYEYLRDAVATSVQDHFAVASDFAFYVAGGINNRRRSIDRIETFRRRPDSFWFDGIENEPVHLAYEWPQWRPMRKKETCQRIWCDWKTSGPPMHSHRCGTPKAEYSFSTKVNGEAHYCDSEFVENY